MTTKHAVLIDGGFLTKVLQKRLQRFPTVDDVACECERVRQKTQFNENSLLRFYYYDAPPVQKSIKNPLDGRLLELGKTTRAQQGQRLLSALELKDRYAVRLGETVVHGWKLGSAATKDMQRNPRLPIPRDFQPDIVQKGVDLRIGLDIARLSLRQLVDAIVVIAGDSDLIPAFKFARREGIQIFVDSLGQRVVTEFKAHADRVLDSDVS